MTFWLALALLSLLAAIAFAWAAAAARAHRVEQERTEKFIHWLRACNTDWIKYRR